MLRDEIAESLSGNCLRERYVGDEHSALGVEMDRTIPQDQSGFETILLNVMFCRPCDTKERRCTDAFESPEGAAVWVERYAK
ncbi:hypothetical protein LZC95_17280 [Pendulispora brunnea]|uniref:Uncharacterized protein n=1 Tax=Pendulispora brunnea TaxID=2905690 RepID=A0ABZ2KQF1_9BACT